MSLEKQRILFFTRSMQLGGTEKVVLQLCEILNPVVDKIIVCSSGGVNEKKLEKMGIEHYLIPDIENKAPTTILKTCITLKQIIKKEHITIIHTHHRMAAFYVSILRLYKNCKFINTCHNTFMNKKIMTKYAYQNATLVACGQKVKENLLEQFGLNEKNIIVVSNSVKENKTEISKNELFLDLKEQGYLMVGNIGRLSRQKGFEYFIDAIPAIIEKVPETKFFIVGTGEDETKLKDKVNDMGLQENVYFLGYRTDVQNIMSKLDLVVLSSLWEGFPLTPIEAFSVGKTIVATAVDGTVEIVKDRENGLLVDAKNVKQLAESISYLLINVDERKRLEQNAKNSFLEHFSFEVFAKKYLDVYENVLR